MPYPPCLDRPALAKGHHRQVFKCHWEPSGQNEELFQPHVQYGAASVDVRIGSKLLCLDLQPHVIQNGKQQTPGPAINLPSGNRPSFTIPIREGSLLCAPQGPVADPHPLLRSAGLLGKLASLEPLEPSQSFAGRYP
ncbi:hypothetical protein CB1_000443008 [Camelus ferus]|nr:hypothetical protein CB1_000443008 [Camelus ferus]